MPTKLSSEQLERAESETGAALNQSFHGNENDAAGSEEEEDMEEGGGGCREINKKGSDKRRWSQNWGNNGNDRHYPYP